MNHSLRIFLFKGVNRRLALQDTCDRFTKIKQSIVMPIRIVSCDCDTYCEITLYFFIRPSRPIDGDITTVVYV